MSEFEEDEPDRPEFLGEPIKSYINGMVCYDDTDERWWRVIMMMMSDNDDFFRDDDDDEW